MEATHSNKRTRAALTLALSIAALLILVNARAEPLTSVNSAKAPAKLVKKSPKDFERLVQLLIERGNDSRIGNNLAPVIGLEKASDAKQQDVIIKQDDKAADFRSCFVIYADEQKTQPMCLYLKRSKQTHDSVHSKYFRVNLAGILEKAVWSDGKKNVDGQVVRGSGIKTEQDIESPEVKKEFNAEMAYWLKDWLKKESKTPSKKDSASTTPAAGKTATAAL